MPNWYLTEIHINHENKNKELNRLQDLIFKWTENNTENNSFGNDWLGNIVIYSGVGTVDSKADTDLRCRGNMLRCILYNNQLQISTETAWNPMLKMWQKVIEKYLPTAEIIYTAIEPGCGLCATNDTNYVGKYYIDVWDFPDIDSEYCANEDYVVEVLQKYLKSDKGNVEELLEEFNNKEHDGFEIYKWEYVPIEDWD